ncbi:MAG: hypothetical protein ACKOCZ_09950, partial [Betaproteobacteria bacterium]
MVRLLAIACVLLHAISAYAARGTDDLLLELRVAVRGLELNAAQKGFLNEALESTKKLPSVTTDTKKSFRQAITAVVDKNDSSFQELMNVVATHYEGRLKETVTGHYELAGKWAKFDDSLNPEQRMIFRGKMAPTITKTFNSMTGATVRLAQLDNLANEESAKRLGLSESQIKNADSLFQDAAKKVASLNSTAEQMNTKIARVFSDPSASFLDIPEA